MNINDFFNASATIFNNDNSKKDGLYKNKLTLHAGNEYLVRLLPYLKEGKEGYNKTSFHYWMYSWRSNLDGRWQYIQSPKTWGERCPMTEFYFKALNSKNEAAIAQAKSLSYKENCYYNVYVVNDPSNPANNGTVKILQAPKQLNSVILEAASSDEKVRGKFEDEFGIDNMRNAIFDLSPNGINLCIKVTSQGDFPNYQTSAFTRRQRDLKLTSERMDEIFGEVYDLTTIDKQYSPEEAEHIFVTTFLGGRMEMPKAPTPAPVEVSSGFRTDYDESTPESTPDEMNLDELTSYLDAQANEVK